MMVALMTSVAGATQYWTGATSSDWSDGSNWDAAPDSTERRNIPSNGSNAPEVSADSTAGVVTMGRNDTGGTIGNSTLTISSGTLTVTSAGNQLVTVSYSAGANNSLVVDGGNLVVYHNGGAGTGEIRLQQAADATCVGNLYLKSGSIDTERLNMQSSTGGGQFHGSCGTLTVRGNSTLRGRIDKFGKASASLGFSLGSTRLEIANSNRTSEIGAISIGEGGESDFIINSTSVLALDIGATEWDTIASHGSYTIGGTLDVDFGTFTPTYNHSWVVWTIDASHSATNDGAGSFDTITSTKGIVTASWDDADTLRLTYTPEPATIALFGLGLLVLRRNKK